MPDATLETAAELHRRGDVDEAARQCERVLLSQPDNAIAQNMMGVLRGLQGRLDDAAAAFARAVALQPRTAEHHRNLALTLSRQGHHGAAAESFHRAATLRPSAAALGEAADAALRAGRHAEAAQDYRAALSMAPDDAALHFGLGAALMGQDRAAEATVAFTRALELDPTRAAAWVRLAAAQRALGATEAAIDAYRKAVAIRPDLADAHFALGNTLASLGRHAEAAASFQAALAARPKFAAAANNLGIALGNFGRVEAGMAELRRAIALKPDHAGAHNNLGNALASLGRTEEAVVAFKKAIELTPARADLHSNLGNSLLRLHRYDEALASYREALRFEASHPNALAQTAHVARLMCDWRDGGAADRELVRHVVERGRPCVPFPLLSIVDDPAAQLACARQYWAHRQIVTAPRPVAPPRRTARLRLAYISADFGAHPVASLTAGMFELHDRARFEVFAFAHGRNDKSAMRQRLERAFDGFFDVWQRGDDDVAGQIREMGVDVLVDLTGHTSGGRLEILARRPAPIQVHYLGYPGALGVDFIDYTIVDRFIAPPQEQVRFDERLVHLPGCFQINDPKRVVSDRRFTRAKCGLPDSGFVFCCFNHSYKIAPAVFDIWMRLLRAVPASVLWLPHLNRWAEANLRDEARMRGVDPVRLVFAPRLDSQAEHLARYRLADLFLDTLPYNAHTTASDALCVGLPVLTCAGRSLAARVAGSLLHAVGLPELVTDSLEEYHAMAVRLATHPDELTALRARLARNLPGASVFDAERTTRHIEQAYLGMWDIHARGEPSRSFAVSPR